MSSVCCITKPRRQQLIVDIIENLNNLILYFEIVCHYADYVNPTTSYEQRCNWIRNHRSGCSCSNFLRHQFSYLLATFFHKCFEDLYANVSFLSSDRSSWIIIEPLQWPESNDQKLRVLTGCKTSPLTCNDDSLLIIGRDDGDKNHWVGMSSHPALTTILYTSTCNCIVRKSNTFIACICNHFEPTYILLSRNNNYCGVC